jgi:hypothetical protein
MVPDNKIVFFNIGGFIHDNKDIVHIQLYFDNMII